MSSQPTLNGWFSTTIEYEGWGRAEFADPPGVFEGPVEIHYNALGEADITMQVEKTETGDFPVESFHVWSFFQGGRHVNDDGSFVYTVGTRINPCIAFRVTCAEGIFVASEEIYYDYTTENGLQLQFTPSVAYYQVTSAPNDGAKYWMIPLLNFVAEFYPREPLASHHPLRLSSPQSSTKEELILFEYNDELGFIEPLPDFQQRKSQLESGELTCTPTAIMVGETETELHPESIRYARWLPLTFVRILELATGREMSVSWIELRTAQADLVQRVHVYWRKPVLMQGRAIVPERRHYSAIGALLTASSTSSHISKTALRVAIRHVLWGVAPTLTVEDRFSHLFRGVETLCESFGYKTQNLLQSVSPTLQPSIRTELATTAQRLRAIAHATPTITNQEVQIIEKIASRTRNASNVDRDFGLAVTALLADTQFQLPDAEIINAHYSTNPRRDGKTTWSAVLSDYRAAAVHTGYFDIRGNKHDRDDLLVVTKHLHDVLARIILKMLNYDGLYQPTMRSQGDGARVNWVHAGMSARQLGYS